MAEASRGRQLAVPHKAIWVTADDPHCRADAWDVTQHVLTALPYRYVSEYLEPWASDYALMPGARGRENQYRPLPLTESCRLPHSEG